MGTRLPGFRPAPVCAAAAVVLLATSLLAPAPASAARRGDDVQIAQVGTLVAEDLPDGFSTKPDSGSSNAENIRLAKGIGGCAPYVALQKATAALPTAQSASFEDATRKVSNKVDVFNAERAASAGLALYAKPSLVGCLEKLYEKSVRQDPDTGSKIDDVVVTLERQDIAGLGDDSVVYEGTMVLTDTDGSTAQLGIGNAAVRVGRVVDAVSFLTSGGDLTEILTPAIDASVGRLRAALGGTTT